MYYFIAKILIYSKAMRKPFFFLHIIRQMSFIYFVKIFFITSRLQFIILISIMNNRIITTNYSKKKKL